MHAGQVWRSLGLVHVAAGEAPGHLTHAAYPTPLLLPDGRVRMFYAARNAENHGSTWSIDLQVSAAGVEKLGPPTGPWLLPGPRGGFDDEGASVAWVGWMPDGGVECLYLGWTKGVSVPFRNFIGRAVAAPGAAHFERTSRVPLLDRSEEDAITLGYPWVVETGVERWMWYGTHLSWGEGWLEMDHPLRRAVQSAPGGPWRRDAGLALRPAGGEEFALSRPTVVRDAAGWHMWYCRRFPLYRLGYAWSPDGLAWERRDAEVSFAGEPAPWEADSRCYPAVFDHGGRRFMAYNGVGYGRSGFGIAVLEEG